MMRSLYTLVSSALALWLLAPPLHADQILGPGRIDSSNRVLLPGGPTLGTWRDGKYIAQPDVLQIKGAGSSAPSFAVGRQASPDGLPGGLLIGGAGSDESGAGAMLGADGIANWTRIQPSKNYNPQEFNIYGTQAQGFASVAAGGNTITRVTSASGDPGSVFDPTWVGRLFYWGRATYRVASVANGSTLTVTTPTGGAVSFPQAKTDRYHYVRTTGSGLVKVSGTSVTRISGDPFIPFISGTDFKLRIAGADYTIASFIDKDHVTLTASAGTQASAAFDYSLNIYDQISSLRVQKTIGIDEENLTFSARATGEYEGRIGRAGSGQYYPLRWYNGDSNGAPTPIADFSPGMVALGGIVGSEALRVSTVGGLLNRLEVAGGSAGLGPSILARGAEANVPLNIDTQGGGGVNFTSNTFGQTIFQVFGTTAPGQNWLAAYAFTTPAIQAQGPGANVPVAILGKGNAGVYTSMFVRSVDPTAADIISGQCVDWLNNTSNTLKHVCNVGGALRSVTLN